MSASSTSKLTMVYSNILRMLDVYPTAMHLKMFVDNNDYELKNLYIAAAENHNNKLRNQPTYIDAGIDLYIPMPATQVQDADNDIDTNIINFFGTGWPNKSPVNKVDFNIKCSAQMYTDTGKVFNTGYYVHPRSSLSKTNLRLANATGIIDAGYRGNIIGMFDVVNIDTNVESANCYVNKYDRLVQICAPSLVPIILEIVDSLLDLGEETDRGTGGLGSTGR